MVRYVALGDSLTEGVGDPHPARPNGLRGWADLLARGLGEHDPASEYANFALRAKRAVDVRDEQVDRAIELRPDLVTLWAGGNDLLRPVLRLDSVLGPTEDAVTRLAGTGARVVLLTGFELSGSPVLRLLRHRVLALNAGLRVLAHEHGALLVDVASRAEWADRRFWAADRVHPSPLGHARIADRVAQSLRMPLTSCAAPLTPLGAGSGPSGIREWWGEERTWWRDHVHPACDAG